MTNVPQEVEKAVAQAKELNERFVEIARKVGLLYVDGCEKSLDGVVAFERKLAEQGPNEAYAGILKAQAEVTQEFARVWAKVARETIAVSPEVTRETIAV